MGHRDFIGFEAMAANNSGRNDLCAETGIERHWREEAERAASNERIEGLAAYYNQAIAAYAPCLHDPAGLRQGPCPQCVALQDVRAKTALTKAAKKGRK